MYHAFDRLLSGCCKGALKTFFFGEVALCFFFFFFLGGLIRNLSIFLGEDGVLLFYFYFEGRVGREVSDVFPSVDQFFFF